MKKENEKEWKKERFLLNIWTHLDKTVCKLRRVLERPRHGLEEWKTIMAYCLRNLLLFTPIKKLAQEVRGVLVLSVFWISLLLFLSICLCLYVCISVDWIFLLLYLSICLCLCVCIFVECISPFLYQSICLCLYFCGLNLSKSAPSVFVCICVFLWTESIYIYPSVSPPYVRIVFWGTNARTTVWLDHGT